MKGDDKMSRTSDDKNEDILRRRALARQRYGNMQLDLTNVSLPMEPSNGDINMYSGLKSPSFDINIARGRV